MAITGYVPPIKKIVDRRKPEGGYYVAECEVCGTTYYPERSNSKYCTPKCGLISHRMAVANGTATKRPPKVDISKITAADDVVRGAMNVYNVLKSHFNTRGDRNYIISSLAALEIGKTFSYQKAHITKITEQKFLLK